MAGVTAPLGPMLGRLAAPPAGGPFEPIRLAMVDGLVAAHARGELDGAAWLAAWTTAMTAIRDQVLASGRAALERAAEHSRYPAGRLVALLPDDAMAETLLEKLLAEGIALEELEGADRSVEATRRRGAALETGWYAAVRLARTEGARLTATAERVMAWRRPWRPLLITGAVLVLLAVLVAAMIGGLIPAPGWFQPLIDWFWGLPWP